MSGLGLALRAARELGPGPVLQYAWYRAGLITGRLRARTPVTAWENRPLAAWLRPRIPSTPDAYLAYRRSQPEGLFGRSESVSDLLRHVLRRDRGRVLEEAEEVLAGRLRLFGGAPADVGFPPDWRGMHGEALRAVDPETHWSGVELSALGDIRTGWEVSRFGWVYSLARAYCLAADARFAEGFWNAFEAWRRAWPINAGPDWVSGQEVAIRMMALVFARDIFLPYLSKDAERHCVLSAAIAAHADRIGPTLIYARAQRNNHLLSEAAGLHTAGVVFPEFACAERWRRQGWREFAAGVRDQIFEDGGYIQHSSRYARLALELSLWTTRVAERRGRVLPEDLRRRLGALTTFLARLTDPRTGAVSRFGNDDGSTLWRLASLEGADPRASVQAAATVFLGRPIYPQGPWDETSLWLGLSPRGGLRRASTGETASGFLRAGMFVMESKSARACLRCVRFDARPAHSDQLQLELWAEGRPVVLDPGTLRYQGQSPLDEEFRMARAHNGPVLPGREPMSADGRFLWLNWSAGILLGRRSVGRGGVELVIAAQDGYRRRGIELRRTVVRIGSSEWYVVDEAFGRGAETLRAAWTIPDLPGRLSKSGFRGRGLSVDCPLGSAVAVYRRGKRDAGRRPQEPSPAWGWYAPTYGTLAPAATIVCEISGRLPLRLVTRFRLPGAGASTLHWSEPAMNLCPIRAVTVGRRTYAVDATL